MKNNNLHTEEEFARDLLQNAKKVSLNASEKTRIFSELSSVMNKGPKRLSWYDSFELSEILKAVTNHKFMKFVPVGLVAVLVLMISVSYSAKNSLPGELFYPVKINVNEKVESFATFGAKSSAAEVDATHASTRLLEVEKLAEQDKLSSTTAAQAAQSFSDDADKVKMQADSLEAEGNTEEAAKINSDFTLSLQNHQDLIQAISSSTPKEGEESALISNIKEKVQNRLKEFQKRKENGEAKLKALKKKTDDQKNATTTPKTASSTPENISTTTLKLEDSNGSKKTQD